MTTKLIVIAGFIIAFAAGLMTGMQRRQTNVAVENPTPSTTRSTTFRSRNNRGDPGIVIRELGLTHEQSAQMRAIWSEVAMRGGPNQEEIRNKLRQQRDEQMLALVPEPDRAQYEKVQEDFRQNMAKLDQEFRNAYDQAVEKTKKILNPEQLAIYERILERNQGWDRNRGRGMGRNNPRRENDRPPKSDLESQRPEKSATSQPSLGQ
jgi:hypothetical protein